MNTKKTFAIDLLIGNQVKSYSANIEREELFSLIEKRNESSYITIPLGEGTSYLDGNEYKDNASITIFPSTVIASIVEHNLEEKKADINLKTE